MIADKFDPALYPRSWTHPVVPIPEHEVQAACIDALQAHGLVVWVIDAGGAGMRGKLLGILRQYRMPPQLAQRIVVALFGGAPTAWPDLFTLLPGGRACFVEVKRPACWDPVTGLKVQKAGVPTTQQLRFLEAAAKRGAAAGVAWHPRDALRVAGIK